MKNLFNSIKLTKPKKSVFDLTHDVKLSFNMGELIPVMCTETVPGDSFNISCESLLRFAPLVAPVMHRMDVTMHYFFVPTRLLWAGWEGWITNSQTPIGSYPTVVMETGTYSGPSGSLPDYMGIPKPPTSGGTPETISALPFAAYQRCYYDYYRDQNLVPDYNPVLQDGDNSAAMGAGWLGTLRRRSWEHDYFTAALPFAQWDSAVSVPLGTIELNPDWSTGGNPSPKFVDVAGTVDDGTVISESVGGFIKTSTDAGPHAYDPNGSLEVAPTTINDLRRAYKLQEWLEKIARGGHRYVENILVMFGVKSSDARLQRAEYITGTKSPVTISEIVNTTGTTDLPQGNMAGHGVAVTSGHAGNYFCEEHGFIVGIMSVMPKTAYQQGISRMWNKFSDPTQHYFPSFANLGEQEVLNKELYAYTATGENTFGYVPRYAEYKFENNRVAGDFRDNLDFWHLGRIFATQPALNQNFIECDPDDRIFAVTDPTEQKLYAHVLNKVRAIRPMPKYGTPTF